MLAMKLKNSATFEGINKLNDVSKLINWIAFIIPQTSASEDAISRFKAKAPAVNA